MLCDAVKIRAMMYDHRIKKANYTIDDVLSATTSFSQNKVSDKTVHYFKVELLGITEAKTELCNLKLIKDYLSFTVPVGYAPQFHFRSKIRDYAKSNNFMIQEYNISINGERILKQYTPSFTTSKGNDAITDVKFKEFKDDNGSIVAWLWFGVSCFQAVLKPENKMRGIRLRCQNIQIGDEDTLQKLFKEDRGQHYFIGEVFSISDGLLPDSQRDYFEHCEAREQFEKLLYDFFNDDLLQIYKKGSEINSSYSKIEKAEQIESEIFTSKTSISISGEQRSKLERAKKEAEIAVHKIEKLREKSATKLSSNDFSTVDVVIHEIIKSNEEKYSKYQSQLENQSIPTNEKSKTLKASSSVTKMSYKKNEKFVPISIICDIIRKSADSSIADTIISKIKEELL